MRQPHYACQSYAPGAVVAAAAVGKTLPMKTMKALGVAVRTRRNARKLTQEALAEAAKLDQASISRVERGEVGVTIGSLARIAAALNVRVSTLWLEAEGLPAEAVQPKPAGEGMGKVEQDVAALQVAVGVMASVFASKRPAEGKAFADALRETAKNRPGLMEQETIGQLVKVFDRISAAAKPARSRPKAKSS